MSENTPDAQVSGQLVIRAALALATDLELSIEEQEKIFAIRLSPEQMPAVNNETRRRIALFMELTLRIAGIFDGKIEAERQWIRVKHGLYDNHSVVSLITAGTFDGFEHALSLVGRVAG